MKKIYFIIGLYLLFSHVQAITNTALNISIEYDLVVLGNDRYQYIYTVTNNTSNDNSTALKIFDLEFDGSLYNENNLVIKTLSSVDWTESLLFSVVGVAPVYDAFSLTGIADNQTVTGFTVEFTWLGTGLPLSQPFSIYDADSATLLETGTTQLKQVLNVPPVLTAPVIVPTNNTNPQNTAQAVPSLSLPFFFALNMGLFLLVFFQQIYLSRSK